MVCIQCNISEMCMWWMWCWARCCHSFAKATIKSVCRNTKHPIIHSKILPNFHATVFILCFAWRDKCIFIILTCNVQQIFARACVCHVNLERVQVYNNIRKYVTGNFICGLPTSLPLNAIKMCVCVCQQKKSPQLIMGAFNSAKNITQERVWWRI